MDIILREVGNSLTTTIPHDIVKSLNVKKGDILNVVVEDNRIIMTPKKKRLRGERFLEEYYNKPIDEIGAWDVEHIDTGVPMGEEVW